MSKPPALLGDSQSLTFTGIYENLPTVNRSKFTEREAFNGNESKFKPYGMGLQVSYSVVSHYLLASNDSDFERVDFITLYKPIQK